MLPNHYVPTLLDLSGDAQLKFRFMCVCFCVWHETNASNLRRNWGYAKSENIVRKALCHGCNKMYRNRTKRLEIYQANSLTDDEIHRIIHAAVDAHPAGTDNPGEFRIVTDQNIVEAVSNSSIYHSWLRTSPRFVITNFEG